MNSLLLPTIYLVGCVATMSIFSHFYRKLSGLKQIEPWFYDANDAKEEYIELLNSETTVNEQELRACLVRRANEGVRRWQQLQNEKAALQRLVRMGSVGEGLWTEFTTAEQDTRNELEDIALEANTFEEGWAQTILSSAAQTLANERQEKMAQLSTKTNDNGNVAP